MKTKGRGKDKKRRKPRSQKTAPMESPEKPKKDILRNIIKDISAKISKKKEEPWSLDIGPPVRVPMLGRHVFKREEIVEIDLKGLDHD